MRQAALRVAGYRFRATLRRRWAGYVGLTVLTGLVGGVALAAVTAARRTDSPYPRFLAGTNPSDLIVQPGTTPTYAPQFLAQLARLPHVRHVGNGVVLQAAQLKRDGAAAEYFLGNGNLQLVAGVNGLFYGQDRVTITHGRMADPSRADQIVVSQAAAAQLGLHVGSRLRTGMYTSSQNVMPRPFRTLDLTVTGIGVFNTEVLQRIVRQVNRIAQSPKVVAATGGGSAGYEALVLPVQRPAEIVNYKTMGAMPAVLADGLAAGAVAALGLTLVASVRRRRRDLALLKTLGFTRRQLAATVAWQATVVAAAGLVIGVPLGIAAGRWLWLGFARELAAVPDPVVPAASLALAAVATLVLANFVAAPPGRSAARTPAAMVLRAE